MKKTTLSLLTGLFLLTAPAGFSQTLSNTDHTITLDNTCINSSIVSGTYTLTLTFVDPDNGPITLSTTSCTVTSNGTSHLTIAMNDLTLPTPASDGYWYLADADNGSINLSGSAGSGIMYWYHDPEGNIEFNCEPLGFHFSGNFIVTL